MSLVSAPDPVLKASGKLQNALSSQYANVTARAILAHVTTHYGTIDADYLEENYENLEAEWDPMTPIEEVFARAKECGDIAEAGNNAITDPAMLRALIKVFTKAGVFETAIHEWKLKAAADKTLDNLTAHFMAANKERIKNNPTTKSMMERSNAMSTQQKPKSTQAPNGDGIKGLHYCWTHGLGYQESHMCATCTDQQEGHQKTAAAFNKMGGNCFMRRSKGEKAVYKRPDTRNCRNNNNSETKTEENTNSNE